LPWLPLAAAQGNCTIPAAEKIDGFCLALAPEKKELPDLDPAGGRSI
jgi:hypothetical protein